MDNLQNQNPDYSLAAGVQSFIQRVYQWMAAGLAITGIVAFWVATNTGLLRAMAGGLFWVVMIAEFGIVLWLSASITRISASAATIGFLIYSALNGMMLSFIFLVYTSSSIALTFFVTAGTFGAVSLFGWATKTDLTSMGGFMFMALIGVILASVVNFFLHSPALYWMITYAGLAVFIGLTAWDTQKLKMMQQSGGGTEQMAVFGALQLYLDFINMFLLLLRIMGRRRD